MCTAVRHVRKAPRAYSLQLRARSRIRARFVHFRSVKFISKFDETRHIFAPKAHLRPLPTLDTAGSNENVPFRSPGRH